MRTSVVVCTYNEARLPLLRGCLAGVADQGPPCDELVVVVDHNPPLADVLRAELPDVVVLESAGPHGRWGAPNTGIATASGELVVLLDDDAVPRPDWLAGLVAPFADPSVACVGGRAEPAWEQGDRPSWLPPELDWVVGCSFVGQQRGDVRNPIGASMALRADVLAEVGGFATELGRVGTLPLGCEETELGLRVNRAGGRVVLVEDSVVDHFVPQQRARLRYVLHRCYAEGLSKAVVRRLAAADGAAALGPELAYARVLLRAMGRPSASALVVPLAGVAATAGFVRGSLAH